MSFADIRELFAETGRLHQQTYRQIETVFRGIEDLRLSQAEINCELDKLRLSQAETDRQLEYIAKLLRNIEIVQGEVEVDENIFGRNIKSLLELM